MKKAKLLWLDLEMTGLDPQKDKILEVAAIATDMNFNAIATYEAVVKVDENLMKERMVGEFWEKNQASRDALMAQNEQGKSVKIVEKELLEFAEKYFGKEIYLPAILSTKTVNLSKMKCRSLIRNYIIACSMFQLGKFILKMLKN